MFVDCMDLDEFVMNFCCAFSGPPVIRWWQFRCSLLLSFYSAAILILKKEVRINSCSGKVSGSSFFLFSSVSLMTYSCLHVKTHGQAHPEDLKR